VGRNCRPRRTQRRWYRRSIRQRDFAELKRGRALKEPSRWFLSVVKRGTCLIVGPRDHLVFLQEFVMEDCVQKHKGEKVNRSQPSADGKETVEKPERKPITVERGGLYLKAGYY